MAPAPVYTKFGRTEKVLSTTEGKSVSVMIAVLQRGPEALCI